MRADVTGFLACLVALALPVAARGQNLAICRKIGDAPARLSCFDAIAAAEAAEMAPRDTITKMENVVGPSAPARYEAADIRKLARAPALYVNRPVLFRRARCTYANVNDYRCTLASGQAVEIRAPIVVPPPVQTAVEGRCGTLYHDRKSACEGTVRVIPTAIKRDGGTSLVVEAPSITIEFARR